MVGSVTFRKGEPHVELPGKSEKLWSVSGQHKKRGMHSKGTIQLGISRYLRPRRQGEEERAKYCWGEFLQAKNWRGSLDGRPNIHEGGARKKRATKDPLSDQTELIS